MKRIVKREWPVIKDENTTRGIIPAISEGHMGAPALYASTDYSIFNLRTKDRAKERGAMLTAKMQHENELQRYYGDGWKKHLNIPSRSVGTIRLTF